MDIELNFINQSNDANNSEVVIFQRNVATTFEEIAVAWKVIKNCGRGWTHRFTYPMDFYVAARDSWGNVSDMKLAVNGNKWDVVKAQSGDILSLDSTFGGANEVEVKNCLAAGSIDAQIYKNGKLLATKTGVSPQEKAVFEFEPYIWVGVVSQVEEGDIMNSAILTDINTKVSLLGITKADIVMTGGGIGSTATPFEFKLVPRS